MILYKAECLILADLVDGSPGCEEFKRLYQLSFFCSGQQVFAAFLEVQQVAGSAAGISCFIEEVHDLL